MNRSTTLWLGAAVTLLVMLGIWYRHDIRPALFVGTTIAGGDGGGLPRADAAAEGFDPAALRAAAAWAQRQQASALLVLRHEHLVFEQYGNGAAADSMVDGGEFVNTLLQLAAGAAAAPGSTLAAGAAPPDEGVAAAAVTASGLSYPDFLSRNLWQPLNAGPAQWSGSTMHARASDWLRVAGLLLQDGRFEGTQVVPAGWSLRIRRPLAAAGAEPFVAADMFLLRGPGATRLWLAPGLALAILYVQERPGHGSIDETRMPNMIVRALRERQNSAGVSLNDLVPGH